MLKLLIFDLDGTLADTGKDITDALNYALKPFGAKHYSVEETKAMVGTGISKLLESLIPASYPDRVPGTSSMNITDNGKPEEIVLDRFLQFYSAHLLDNTAAYPHVNNALAELSDYKKAVLSNKRTEYSAEILNRLGLSHFFDAIWGSNSVREKKPSPAGILDLIGKFEASKDSTVIIGDSNFDLEAGRAAGIKVIGVTYGFRAREYLAGADYIIDSFDELLKVIPEIPGN